MSKAIPPRRERRGIAVVAVVLGVAVLRAAARAPQLARVEAT